MGMSVGSLTVVILFVAVLHAGLFFAYYRYKQSHPNAGPKVKLSVSTKNRNRWAILFLMIFSWILSVVAAASCTFLTVKVKNTWFDPKNTLDFGMGFAKFKIHLDLASTFSQDGGCENYDNSRLSELTDKGFVSPSAANAFVIFNCLLTTLGIIGMSLMQCKLENGRKRVWLALQMIMYLSWYCCLLSFYIQESSICDSMECSLGGPGIAQVINSMVLLGICVLLFITDFGSEPGIRTAMCHRSAASAVEHNHFMKKEKDAEQMKEANQIPRSSRKIKKENVEGP